MECNIDTGGNIMIYISLSINITASYQLSECANAINHTDLLIINYC